MKRILNRLLNLTYVAYLAHDTRYFNERQPYLDGLRGYASLIVLLAHLIISLLPAVITLEASAVRTSYDLSVGMSPIGVFWNGNAAVCVFFVLSGYVLTNLAQRSKLSMAAQVVRRYVRLVLPMTITILLPAVLMKLGAMHNAAAAQVSHSGWLSLWYQFVPSFRGAVWEALYGAFAKGQSAYNSNLWTMRTELLGSLAVFIITAMHGHRMVRLVCYAVFIVLTYLDYYPLFAVGAILYDFRDVGMPARGHLGLKSGFWSALLFGIGLYLCAIPAASSYETMTWFGFLPVLAAGGDNARYWHEFGAMLVMAGLLNSLRLQVFFSNRFSQWLGKISFTLYLIQLPIICSFTAWLILRFQHLGYIALVALTGLISLVFILVAATVFSTFVDTIPTLISRQVGRAVDRIALNFQRGPEINGK